MKREQLEDLISQAAREHWAGERWDRMIDDIMGAADQAFHDGVKAGYKDAKDQTAFLDAVAGVSEPDMKDFPAVKAPKGKASK